MGKVEVEKGLKNEEMYCTGVPYVLWKSISYRMTHEYVEVFGGLDSKTCVYIFVLTDLC